MEVDNEFIQEVKNTIERCIILLEDNPKIKDVSGFYSGEDLMHELKSLLNNLN